MFSINVNKSEQNKMYERPSLKILGKRIKAERKRLKLSQEKFAEIGGVKRVTQYMYEQGDRSPSMEYLARLIAEDLDLGFLFFGQKTGNLQSGLHVDKDVLLKVFKLVDEFGRDPKGRLLDIEYRAGLYESLCDAVSGKSSDEIDWDVMRDTSRELVG